MKRSPIRRRTGINKKKTQKQIAFEKELNEVRTEVLGRAEWACELMTPQICTYDGALHLHHRRSRRVRKDGKANNPSNLMVLCPPCHALVHHDRSWSKDHGFIISSFADPDEVHVNRTGVHWMPRKGQT